LADSLDTDMPMKPDKMAAKTETTEHQSAGTAAGSASDASPCKPKLPRKKPRLSKKSSLEEALLTIDEIWRDITLVGTEC
jgi:hypothetical protein